MPDVAIVRGIKVLPNKAPDCSSLKSIVETVTRDCKTNDEKAIAIYNFMARLESLNCVTATHQLTFDQAADA